MTYSQNTAFDLLNEGSLKRIFPPLTGPSPKATHEQKQRRPPPNGKEASW